MDDDYTPYKVAELLGIQRIYYSTVNENSLDLPLYTCNGEFIGYPETDEHFRKRVLKELREIGDKTHD